MSGHKRATIKLNRQDIQRIEQLASQLRQVEYDTQQIQSKIQQNRKQTFQHFNDTIQTRLESYECQLGNYQQQIGLIESQTNQALFEQADALQALVLENRELWQQNAQTLTERYLQHIQLCMQENQQALNDHYDELSHVLGDFQNEQDRRGQLAYAAMQDSQAMVQTIDQVYDHERYFPGALNRLTDQAALAAQNLQDGMLEASLVISQQISQGASILRLSIEEILQKTALNQAVAIEKVRELEATIQRNAFINAIDLSGRELDIEIDVDFWTSGHWQGLKRRCEKFLDQLQTSSENLDYDDLDHILKFVLPQLEQSLQDIVSQARMKVILSQIRFNIAECVLDSLAEQGFEARKAVYTDQDERKPFQVVMQNLEGSEIHVQIDSADPVGAYIVQVNSYEAFPGTESEMIQRSIQIFSGLRERGLRVSPPVELAAPESEISIHKKKYAQNPLQLAH